MSAKKLTATYIPDASDLIWIDFTPQAGHEQAGRRPALVLSSALYNGKVGLALICPITSQVKGYPFEVALPAGLKVGGVVLSDHVKNLDWTVRGAQKIDTAPMAVMMAVRARIAAVLGIAGNTIKPS